MTKDLVLSELDPLRLIQALNHVEQRRNVGVVADLLRQMDDTEHNPLRLYNLQVVLFRASYRAQQAEADISRVIKRLAIGKNPDWMGTHDAATLQYLAPSWALLCEPDSPSQASWELERLVAHRAVRQLQDVGDGLAWRVHRYDRRVIVALANHEAAGPIVNKSGINYEIGRVVERFADSGEFSLLHDLTTVLRHHDLTEVHHNGYRELREIKARPTKGALAKASKQRRRTEVALAAATGSAPLESGGPLLVQSDIQLRTHVRDLSQVMATAQRDGYSVARVRDRVVGIMHYPAIAKSGQAPEDILDAYHARLDTAFGRHLRNSINRLYARVGFTEARDAFFAPYSIYPLQAAQRAALICDLTILETWMDAETLSHGFGDLGLETRCLLGPNSHEEADVLEIRHGHTRMTLHRRAVSQLLFEFVQTRCFARAFATNLANPPKHGRVILTFSNEGRAWR